MGEIAALATSFLWSFTSILFTLAGQRVGPVTVNRARLVLAVLYLSLTHLLLYGELWPAHAEPFRWGWLGLSGTVGLALGDTCLYQAFLFIGTQKTMLLMTLVPVVSTLLAWGWLGEALQPLEIGAVLLTVVGVAWVVAERQHGPGAPVTGDRRYALGVLLGLGSAIGQALGLVLAKQGLVGEFPTLSATLIRMLVATAAIWALTLAQGQARAVGQALKDRRAALLLVSGSLTGPFLGVWASLIAVQQAHVGIASTLMSLSPIILIPLTRWAFHEEISSRAVLGTVVALVGAAVIFLT